MKKKTEYWTYLIISVNGDNINKDRNKTISAVSSHFKTI